MQFFEKLNNVDRTVPLVMGVLNVTPDSFSDGGRFMSKSSIIVQVNKMVAAGVDIVDIGGESTRPGAKIVSIEEELQRVSSAIEWVKEVSDIPISVDTYKTEVMRGVLDLNIDMINDVNALQAEGAIKVVSSSSVLVCLMHKQGDFRTMQHNPLYNNVVETVAQFLEQRVLACKKAGIKNENILIDPGFGFGKTLLHNVELFKSLDKILQIGSPVLIGVSRKSMIGALQGGDLTDSRVVGSVVASVLAMLNGASILRVHDVKETVQALKITSALKSF